jgi:hypothetical protein
MAENEPTMTVTIKVIVVFRVWPDSQDRGVDVIALFPLLPATNAGHCLCYEHVGQHGGADYDGVIAQTKPATPAEYADLKVELEGRDYLLDVRRRRPSASKHCS